MFSKKHEQNTTAETIGKSTIKQAGRDINTQIETAFNIANVNIGEQSKPDFVITHNANADILPSRSFQGREDQLKQLKQYVSNSQKAVLVSGMGGIGKSEICKKLYQEYLDRHKAGETLEIDHIGFIKYEDNMDSTLVNAFQNTLTATTWDEKMAQAWFQISKISNDSRLLLIIDNVNKQPKEDTSLNKLTSLSCSIMITSRNDAFGEFLSYRIDKMEYPDCRALFLSIFGSISDTDEKNLEYIINELAVRHTLTVRLFACIAKDHTWTISRLRKMLEEHHFDLSYLKDGEEEKMIVEYKKLFDLSNLNRKEINLLEAFAVLPYRMLPIDYCNDWMSKDADEESAELLINGISQKGWLERTERQFAMHPVISEVIRAIQMPKLNDHKHLVNACAKSMELDVVQISTQEVPVWIFAETIVKYLFDENSTEISYLLMRGGMIFYHIADYSRALEWYEKALVIREKGLGTEHPDTATTYNNIAGVYQAQGDYDKALEWYKKALAIKEKVLGTEHPHTAATYNNIAGVYQDQGDYVKALEWYKKALAIREKVLGTEHPDTATTYNNIAVVYQDQGDYVKALEWYKKALTIREKGLGTEHPDTAITYNNIARVYQAQGDYVKALEWYGKALAIAEKVLGTEHPDTAATYNNIAGVYKDQGDYDKALEWFEKALAIKEKVLGTEHPDTAATYNNIAGVYKAQGDYVKALEWYQKALAICEKVLGTEHPHTAATYNNIAGVYNAQGDFNKALNLYLKSYHIFFKQLGVNHPNTNIIKNNLKTAYLSSGKKDILFQKWLHDKMIVI
jgi:tetratricopeptide (TPR) repeat protein